LFVFSFAIFGLSFLSVAVVIGISFVFMLFMGMLGLLIKLLPWIIVIGLVIYWFKHQHV
jgi:phage shock protein G